MAFALTAPVPAVIIAGMVVSEARAWLRSRQPAARLRSSQEAADMENR